MKRREFLKTMGNGLLSVAMGPELLGQFLTRSYGRSWGPVLDQARLTAVGIGPLGARMTQILSRNLPDLSCHEIIFDPKSSGLFEMKTLLDVVRNSDLLFVVSGFDDTYSEALFNAVADTGKKSGVPTVGVVPDGEQFIKASLFVDSLWPVSYKSLNNELPSVMESANNREAWTAYALRHTVGTIANLITQNGIICIDFYDVRDILKSGAIGRLGVGVASGHNKGATASARALGRWGAQGCSLQGTSGVLACVSGSTLLTMDDFDEASRIVHESVPEDANILIGHLTDEALGNNVRVTVLALSNEVGGNALMSACRQ